MAEGGALLRRYTGLNPYRGFESLSLRQTPKPQVLKGVLRFSRPAWAFPMEGEAMVLFRHISRRERWEHTRPRRLRTLALMTCVAALIFLGV